MLVTGPLHAVMFRTNPGKLREETREATRIGGVESRPWADAVAGAAIATGVALVSGVLGVMFSACAPPTFSIAATEAIAASGMLAAIAWRAPRLAVGAAIGSAFAILPNEILGCWNALEQPLATMDARSGGGAFDLAFIGALVAFLGSVAAVPFAALVSAVRRRAVAPALVLAAGAALASAFVAAHAVASMSRPEPDDFEQVLDASTLDGGQRVMLGATTLAYDHGPDEMCSLHLSGDTATRGAALSAPEAVCPPLRVLRDRKSGAGMVVPAELGMQAVTRGPTATIHPLAIFGTKDGRAEIRSADLAAELGAPRAWIFSVCVGLPLALLAAVAAIGAARARRAVDGAMNAMHLGDGWVAVGDAKRHVASLVGASPGPVLVTHATPARGATYRDDGTPHALSARPGTRDDLRDEFVRRAIAWSCVAIATVAMTSAPLWTARLSGLL